MKHIYGILNRLAPYFMYIQAKELAKSTIKKGMTLDEIIVQGQAHLEMHEKSDQAKIKKIIDNLKNTGFSVVAEFLLSLSDQQLVNFKFPDFS